MSDEYPTSTDPRPARNEWEPGDYRCICWDCNKKFRGEFQCKCCADCAYFPGSDEIEALNKLLDPMMPEQRLKLLRHIQFCSDCGTHTGGDRCWCTCDE